MPVYRDEVAGQRPALWAAFLRQPAASVLTGIVWERRVLREQRPGLVPQPTTANEPSRRSFPFQPRTSRWSDLRCHCSGPDDGNTSEFSACIEYQSVDLFASGFE
jgi:hypothetical protein